MKNWKYIEGAKLGNALKYTNLEEAKKMCRQINDSLAPDAALRHYRNVYEKDGAYYVMETGEATAKGMKRVGNDTPAEYFSKKPKVIGNEKTGAEGFFKQLSDDVKEREKKDDEEIKLVGNETYQHKLYPDKYVIIEGNNYKIVTDGKVEKSGKITDAVLYGINQTYKRVGNSKWELPDGSTATVEDDGTIKIKKPRDSSIYITKLWDKERAEKQLAQKGAKKVGNALNWDENLVGKFVWVKDKGQEWKVYVMQDKGDKVYIRNDDGSQGWVSKTRITGKVGNSKTGNSAYDDKIPTVEHYKKALDEVISKKGIDPNEARRKYGQYTYKQWEELLGHKIGNSASDDKFAYVMREFDEGKLKTPDGKTVTDPAQAKAIAYSESKKTENGLARARNAIKKS